MKFEILKALNGNLCVCKLDGDDQYLLVFKTKSDTILVPMIKTKTSAYAYAGSSSSAERLSHIETIVDTLSSQKVYKDLYKFRAWPKDAPEHSHVVVDVLRHTLTTDGKAKMVLPEGLEEALNKAGYTMRKKTGHSGKTRDYSELMKNPMARAIYEDDGAVLRAVSASYDSLNTETKVAFESVMSGSANGIIFAGPTGTGKSFAARILAQKAGAPLLNLQITYGTTVEDLVGMFVPNEAPDAKSSFRFVEGPLLKAYREGWQIVLEEINYGQPGVNAKLNEFTDSTTRITLNGVTYHRHPNFVVYMTMNPGYQGTEILNVALKNRFAKVDVPALTKKEFTNRARAYSKSLGHELKAEFFNKLFDFAAFLEKEGSTSKWHENVKYSIRNAQRLCDAILQKTRSFEEFSAAVAVQYLNDLAIDNDNADKLEELKSAEEIKTMIQGLYDLYDLAEVSTAPCIGEEDDFFSDDSPATPGAEDDGLGDAAAAVLAELF